MITIHHLNFSRSTRIIWLMEELGEPYEIVPHTRNPNTFRSPQTLDRIHPLGKAPVIEDGALVMAEVGCDHRIRHRYLWWWQTDTRSIGAGLGSLHRMATLCRRLRDDAAARASTWNADRRLARWTKGFIAPDIEKTLKYIAAEIPDNGVSDGRIQWRGHPDVLCSRGRANGQTARWLPVAGEIHGAT